MDAVITPETTFETGILIVLDEINQLIGSLGIWSRAGRRHGNANNTTFKITANELRGAGSSR